MMKRKTLAIIIPSIIVAVMIIVAVLPSLHISEKLSGIPGYYETDANGNLIRPETTDWLFDKQKPLAEIVEDTIIPSCEYDFAYMSGITDITVMCYKGKWYRIYDAWTGTHYRLPE